LVGDACGQASKKRTGLSGRGGVSSADPTIPKFGLGGRRKKFSGRKVRSILRQCRSHRWERKARILCGPWGGGGGVGGGGGLQGFELLFYGR